MNTPQIWELRVPAIAAQCLSFARGRLGATDTFFVHAAGATINVEIREDAGHLIAQGTQLKRTADTPMARPQRVGTTITWDDCWPTAADYGTPVILAGGEVGILQHWWNSADEQEWRWSLEFYNHR